MSQPLAPSDDAAPIPAVPSGQPLDLLELLAEDAGHGLTWRLRMLAPQVAARLGALGLEAMEADMAHLCATLALPRLEGLAEEARPRRIVVSLSERPVPFGQPAPGVMQIFETYDPADGRCTWEGF